MDVLFRYKWSQVIIPIFSWSNPIFEGSRVEGENKTIIESVMKEQSMNTIAIVGIIMEQTWNELITSIQSRHNTVSIEYSNRLSLIIIAIHYYWELE